MATSSIPAAIDYLVAQIRALPECAAPVTVHDGWPVGSAETAVAVGIVPHEDGATEDDVVEAQLGSNLEREVYRIPCEIAVWIGGAEEAAKPARDKAFGIFDAIVTRVRQDRSLGGALHSAHALVTGVRLIQTSEPSGAGEGRTCSIQFNVRCENRF